MAKFRFAWLLFLLLMPGFADGEALAPVVLNGLSRLPEKIATLPVTDQHGQIIGRVVNIQWGGDGRPIALAFRSASGQMVVVSASAISFDGKELVASNEQPQIAALAVPRMAVKSAVRSDTVNRPLRKFRG